MSINKKTPRVLIPKTINEALEFAMNEPAAEFWAGGTQMTGHSTSKSVINMPNVVIALGHVEELARASRSERSLEIGSMMSLDRLRSIGRRTLPSGLYEAIAEVGNRPIRCRATIGGHLAMKERIGDLKPLLQLLDTRVEIRFLKKKRNRRKSLSSSRRIPLGQINEKPGLCPGELITKISIPTEQWDFGVFKKIRPTEDENRVLVFAALAQMDKGILSECRMAFSDGTRNILRNRELELILAGRPLSFGEREYAMLDGSIDKMTLIWKKHEYERRAARLLVREFLNSVTK